MRKEYCPLSKPETFEERKAQVRYFLGRTVEIVMDRPIGTVHPKHDDIIYPINYGYITGVLGGDGEELDVYLLGVDVPVEKYTAKIIAIVHRKNDVEDKLVAAPEGMKYTAEEIAENIRFQEQFYDSEVETENSITSKAVSVNFYNDGEVSDDKLKFAVICARYNGKWIFSRHKSRETWEIPGGHREDGERIEDTATRELWEETGAVNADIRKVAVYGVEKDGKESYGMLFFADIKRIGNLPDDSEIGEIEMFDTLPKELTYPDIQPYLFNHVQGWLNIQSNADEMWDVYDEHRNLTGKLHRRGDLLGDGEYHLVVHVWLLNSKGEFLLTKRTSNKGFPNMWESTGGSALAGDDSITAAMREIKEEIGLSVDPARGKCVLSFKRKDSFVDVWLFRQDFNLDDVILQEGETCDKMYASIEKVKELCDDGVFVPYSYLPKLLDMVN